MQRKRAIKENEESVPMGLNSLYCRWQGCEVLRGRMLFQNTLQLLAQMSKAAQEFLKLTLYRLHSNNIMSKSQQNETEIFSKIRNTCVTLSPPEKGIPRSPDFLLNKAVLKRKILLPAQSEPLHKNLNT